MKAQNELTNLETEAQRYRESIATAIEKNESIDLLSKQLTEVNVKIDAIRADVNAEAITELKSSMIKALISPDVKKLISRYEKLTGQSVDRFYFFHDAKKSELSAFCFNEKPSWVKGSSERQKNDSVNGSESRNSSQRIVVDGLEYESKAYVEKFGSEKEKAHSYFKGSKWPTKAARTTALRLKHEVLASPKTNSSVSENHDVSTDAESNNDPEVENLIKQAQELAEPNTE